MSRVLLQFFKWDCKSYALVLNGLKPCAKAHNTLASLRSLAGHREGRASEGHGLKPPPCSRPLAGTGENWLYVWIRL